MGTITFGKKDSQVVFNTEGILDKIIYKGKEIALKSKLWSIECNDKDLSIADMKEFTLEEYKDNIKLIWKSEEAYVVVAIKDKGDGKLRWNITSQVYGEKRIKRVHFPIIEGMKFEDENYLVLTWQNGHLIKNPVDSFLSKGVDVPFWMGRGKYSYTNEYPAGLSYQYAAFYSPSEFGYYFATEDADAYIKSYTYEYNKDKHALNFIVTNYPENMGKTSEYAMPYDFVLKMFEGDWQDATKFYREWAINQKWCKEKLVDKKLPDNLVKTDLWRINHTNYAHGTRTQEFFETSKMLRDKMNCNLALHWYGWNMSRHDLDYPEYIKDEKKKEGWPEELRKWNKKFDEEGIVKIPYINARLWELKTKSWVDENTAYYAIKNEFGEFPGEPWNGFELKAVCPSTAMWQNKVANLCKEYSLEEGFDGIYLDQIASYNATLCFDENHPHPVGGGTWWNDSYHNMVRKCRDILSDDAIITTESCCETYVDVFDLFLVLDTCFQYTGFNELGDNGCADSLPLFNLIYGDYALTYGSICVFDSTLENFEYNFIRNTIWGFIPTVEGCEMSELTHESASFKFEVMKRIVDFYKANKDIFLYGRLAEIPEVLSSKSEMEWVVKAKGEAYMKEYDNIIASIWETKDGDKVMFAYNYADKEEIAKINGKEYKLAPKSFAKFEM